MRKRGVSAQPKSRRMLSLIPRMKTIKIRAIHQQHGCCSVLLLALFHLYLHVFLPPDGISAHRKNHIFTSLTPAHSWLPTKIYNTTAIVPFVLISSLKLRSVCIVCLLLLIKETNTLVDGFCFMCLRVLPACLFYLRVYLCTMCIPGAQVAREGVGSPGTGFADGCEQPCACWQSNPGPLEEQAVPLTPEPSL